jgi:hypothetical protein
VLSGHQEIGHRCDLTLRPPFGTFVPVRVPAKGYDTP